MWKVYFRLFATKLVTIRSLERMQNERQIDNFHSPDTDLQIMKIWWRLV